MLTCNSKAVISQTWKTWQTQHYVFTVW